MNMLCRLIQSIKGARKQFFPPRKRFWSELHIFFEEFEVPSLRTVTPVLVSHVLPQLQLFTAHTEQNPQHLLALKKAEATKILTEKYQSTQLKEACEAWQCG